MAYRSYEYVPQPYRPDDSRISELLYLQNQNEANRIRQQGVNTAAMWLGAGRAASGMLSELAQYKREAPQRAEAERLRREADKMRGLQQFAGAGGLDQEGYGKLLQQEGFMERGQDVLDKNMARQATKATYDAAEKKRVAEELSGITQDFYQIEADPNPAAAYQRTIGGLKARLGERGKDLPDEYDPDAVKGFIADIDTTEDIIRRNALAQSNDAVFKSRQASEKEHLAGAVSTLGLLLPKADDEQEWNNAWANLDAQLEPLTPAQRERILKQLPYSRTFSPQAQQQAKELDTEPEPTNPFQHARQAFRRQYGHNPTNPEEYAAFNQMLGEVTNANAGGKTTGGLSSADRVGIERWYANESMKNHDDLTQGLITEDEYKKKARLLEAGYENQMGLNTGSGGRFATTDTAGTPTPRVRGTPGPDAVLISAPDGSEAIWLSKQNAAQIQAMLDKNGKLVSGTLPPGVTPPAGTRTSTETAAAPTGAAVLAPTGEAEVASPPPPPRTLADAAGAMVPPPTPFRGYQGEDFDPNNFGYMTGPRGPSLPVGPPTPALSPRPNTMYRKGNVPAVPQPAEPQGSQGIPSAADGMPVPALPPSATPLQPGQVRITNGRTIGIAFEDELPALAKMGWQPVPTGSAPIKTQDLRAMAAPPPLQGAPVEARVLADAAGPMVQRGRPTPSPQGPLGSPEAGMVEMRHRSGGHDRFPAAMVPGMVMEGWEPLTQARPTAPALRTLPPGAGQHWMDLKPEKIIEQSSVKLPENATMDSRVEAIVAMMNVAGYDIRPISLKRTAKEQDELHRQGLTPRTGKPGDESQHQVGTAADFAFYVGGKRTPKNPKQPWNLLKLAAQKAGLEWGGDYAQPNEYNHVELPGPQH